MEVKGKQILKTTGALMVLFGGLGVWIPCVSLWGEGSLSCITTVCAKGVPDAAVIVPAFLIFSLLWSLLEVITGIVGIKNCGNPKKAKLCFNLGVTVALCTVIATLWAIWVSGFNVVSALGLLSGLALPFMLCYGAKLNRV